MNPVTMKMPDKTEDPESDLVVNETREQWAERKRRDRSNSSQIVIPSCPKRRSEHTEENPDDNALDSYESIDVPVRATCKVQALVRVGKAEWWHTGWLMQSTKKAGGEIGSAKLSTERLSFGSRLLAVNAALLEMAGAAGGHDQRLKDDILAFRDKEWFVCEESADRPSADLDDQLNEDSEIDDSKRHPDEPRANEFGVMVEGVETFEIAIPKTYKAEVRIDIAQGSTGTWWEGHAFHLGSGAGDQVGGIAPVSIDRTPCPSKKAAVLAGCQQLIEMLPHQPKVCKCIAKFQAEVETWEEVITATPDAAQPEAAEPEPTTQSTRPTQAAIVAEFKVRLHDATDDLATAVLARMKAESIFKTAKAEEKAAAETLQKLANRGPERYPLFDAPEGTSNDQVTQAAPVPSNGWKAAPLSVLELPNGIADKLTGDGIDTVGRLEQRRADVANKREKWPKGIGKGAIDKIEDAQLKWLTANQGTWQPPAETVAGTPAEKPDPGSIGDVASRAGVLVQRGFEPTEAELPTYDSGKEAFNKNFALTDCPYVPGHDQDLWLIGFKDAEKESHDDFDE